MVIIQHINEIKSGCYMDKVMEQMNNIEQKFLTVKILTHRNKLQNSKSLTRRRNWILAQHLEQKTISEGGCRQAMHNFVWFLVL